MESLESLPLELELLHTADGTPTIGFTLGDFSERMHNSKGALSESLYIYGQALSIARENGWRFRVLSVGLGLGYNEMIAAAQAIRGRLSLEEVCIWSFETHDFLRRSFSAWVLGQQCHLGGVYSDIAERVCSDFQIESSELRSWLQDAIDSEALQLRGEFPTDTYDIENVTCVLYDAYSSKTSPELWTEKALMQNLNPLLATQCVFSTYASTGILRRSLTSMNFKLLARAGFGGKRESTLGVRE